VLLIRKVLAAILKAVILKFQCQRLAHPPNQLAIGARIEGQIGAASDSVRPMMKEVKNPALSQKTRQERATLGS